MHKIEIPERNLMKEFPSEIAEMTPDQFVYFMNLVLQYLNGGITLHGFQVLLTYKLLDLKIDWRYFRMKEDEREAVNAEIYRISELTESFFEEIEQDGEVKKTFKLFFIRQFIPEICRGKYLGPADALQDITFCEYRMAHSHYAAYLQSKSEEDLNRMIAVLYRPAKRWLWILRRMPSYDGQPRVPLTAKTNPLLAEARAKEVARLPMAIRYGIFLWFSGCERFLTRGPITVDGREIDLSVIYEKPDSSDDSPDIGLIGILYSLAESKVFGDIESADNMGLYDVMIRLYQVVRQAKAIEAKYNTDGIDKHL